MELRPFDPAIDPASLPLEELAAKTNLPEEAKVKELTRQFEAMLLRQILSEAQKTVLPSAYNQESLAKGIYRDLMSNELAESISRAGDFGLASGLETQITRQLPASEDPPSQAEGHEDGKHP